MPGFRRGFFRASKMGEVVQYCTFFFVKTAGNG